MSDSPARRRVVEANPRRPTVELKAIRVIVVSDENPDVSYLDTPEFKARRTAHKRGDFDHIGVVAEADVTIEETGQTILSSGCFGIERDLVNSNADLGIEIEEIAAEEYQELRKVLKTIGVPTSQLPNELDAQWIEWRT